MRPDPIGNCLLWMIELVHLHLCSLDLELFLFVDVNECGVFSCCKIMECKGKKGLIKKAFKDLLQGEAKL